MKALVPMVPQVKVFVSTLLTESVDLTWSSRCQKYYYIPMLKCQDLGSSRELWPHVGVVGPMHCSCGSLILFRWGPYYSGGTHVGSTYYSDGTHILFRRDPCGTHVLYKWDLRTLFGGSLSGSIFQKKYFPSIIWQYKIYLIISCI